MIDTYFVDLGTPELETQAWADKQHFAHADVNWDCPWNVGTDYETSRPTLMNIYVPEDRRYRGYARLLINKIIGYAKVRRVKELWFSNFNPEFWSSIDIKIEWKESDRSVGAIVIPAN